MLARSGRVERWPAAEGVEEPGAPDHARGARFR
jgi:hypothetical protein